jgi:CBS domain-containing protein
MSAGRICSRTVDVAELDESAQVAASRMNARNVGMLVVIDAHKNPVGIVTDRDLAVRIVGKGLDPNTTTLESVMSCLPESITEDTPIESAIAIMRRGPYRRLPVVNEQNQLIGLLSLDDILVLLSEEFEEIGKLVGREGPKALAH